MTEVRARDQFPVGRRAIGREVIGQRGDICTASDRVGALSEGGEPVSTVSEEGVCRHPVCARRIKYFAIEFDRHRVDSVAHRAGAGAAVAEASGDTKDQSGSAGARVVELLLRDLLNLRTGQVEQRD